MIRRPPISTRTDTLFPYTTLFRSARSLGLGLVAEGVESEQQRRFLLELGVPVGQGLLFAPGLRPDEFARRLISNRPTGVVALLFAGPLPKHPLLKAKIPAFTLTGTPLQPHSIRPCRTVRHPALVPGVPARTAS